MKVISSMHIKEIIYKVNEFIIADISDEYFGEQNKS